MSSLSKMGNPLEFISKLVDFEIFHPTLEVHLQTEERKSNSGSRPIDPVLMFKFLFRSMGMVRAKACMTLTNLTYNIAHLVQFFRYLNWINAHS